MVGTQHTPQTGLDQHARPSLTVIILTRDEEIHLPRALASIAPIARRVVIVDSGSTDLTLEIAREAGASVFERGWVNYSEQFQWALDNCEIATDWVMRLDADEWLGLDLTSNLIEILAKQSPSITGISLDRRHHFLGRWIKHGGRYPLTLLRIWRSGAAHIEHRWMDEHIVLDHGEIAHVQGTFVDENLRDLGFFTDKHNNYATREAVDVLLARYLDESLHKDAGLASTPQAARKRSAKSSFYNRLPLAVGPALYFLYRYILQLGFLDGRAGLIYHVLQGFWYRFLVDSKRHELEIEMRACSSNEERITVLETKTGLAIRIFLSRNHSLDENG